MKKIVQILWRYKLPLPLQSDTSPITLALEIAKFANISFRYSNSLNPTLFILNVLLYHFPRFVQSVHAFEPVLLQVRLKKYLSLKHRTMHEVEPYLALMCVTPVKRTQRSKVRSIFLPIEGGWGAGNPIWVKSLVEFWNPLWRRQGAA